MILINLLPHREEKRRQRKRAFFVGLGACAAAGGPYWDAYPVLPGADGIVEVDHYIAGCPPPPSALEDFLTAHRAGGDTR